jgi:hypothetical protein
LQRIETTGDRVAEHDQPSSNRELVDGEPYGIANYFDLQDFPFPSTSAGLRP